MKFRDNIIAAVIVLAIVWAVFILDTVLPGDWRMLGIRPRTISGLWGIIVSPFLHGGLYHILANTGALFVLLLLSLTYSRKLTVAAVVIIMLVGGGLVWLLGMPGTVHVGASGVIFGLIGYLIASGLFRRDIVALIVAAAVLILYGGSLLMGFVPMPGVSWMGHAFGFIAGVLAAWVLRNWSKEEPAEIPF